MYYSITKEHLTEWIFLKIRKAEELEISSSVTLSKTAWIFTENQYGPIFCGAFYDGVQKKHHENMSWCPAKEAREKPPVHSCAFRADSKITVVSALTCM